MTKYFNLLVRAAIIFIMGVGASCTRDGLSMAGEETVPTQKICLTIANNYFNSTKAASETDDYIIDQIVDRTTIYVMEPSASDSSVPGNVVSINSFNTKNQTSFDITTTIGPKFFYVVLNGPAAGSPSNYSAVKALTYSMTQSALLKSSGASVERTSGPLMAGLSAKTNITSSSQNVAVTVSRLVYRVNLKSITNNLPENYTLNVLYCYLSNYVENYTLGNGNASSIVYGNSRGRNSGVINGSSVYSDNGYASIAKSVSITKGEVNESYSDIGMYAFPNPCVTDSWSTTSTSARKTRLVLVTWISGTVFYYPITLPVQQSNNTYDVNVVINNIGTSDPEIELTKGMLTLNLSVTSWSENNNSYTNL